MNYVNGVVMGRHELMANNQRDYFHSRNDRYILIKNVNSRRSDEAIFSNSYDNPITIDPIIILSGIEIRDCRVNCISHLKQNFRHS